MKSLKIAVALFVAATAWSASAEVDSYLYWMVDDNDGEYTIQKVTDQGTEAVSYDYAKVKFGDSYLNMYSTDGSLGSEMLGGGVPGAAGFDSSATYSSFLFELYNSSDELVGWNSLSYSQALASYVYNNPMKGGATSVYLVTAVVPEPTSGLLLLLGLSGLALRRRRAVA